MFHWKLVQAGLVVVVGCHLSQVGAIQSAGQIVHNNRQAELETFVNCAKVVCSSLTNYLLSIMPCALWNCATGARDKWNLSLLCIHR